MTKEEILKADEQTLLRNQITDAIVYSEDLWNRYREILI